MIQRRTDSTPDLPQDAPCEARTITACVVDHGHMTLLGGRKPATEAIIAHIKAMGVVYAETHDGRSPDVLMMGPVTCSMLITELSAEALTSGNLLSIDGMQVLVAMNAHYATQTASYLTQHADSVMLVLYT